MVGARAIDGSLAKICSTYIYLSIYDPVDRPPAPLIPYLLKAS
jgi:hypothetical protein